MSAVIHVPLSPARGAAQPSTTASKAALVGLVRQLERWGGFEMIDCQMATEHLASLGAREIPRREFTARIERLVRAPAIPGPWTADIDLYNGT